MKLAIGNIFRIQRQNVNDGDQCSSKRQSANQRNKTLPEILSDAKVINGFSESSAAVMFRSECGLFYVEAILDTVDFVVTDITTLNSLNVSIL